MKISIVLIVKLLHYLVFILFLKYIGIDTNLYDPHWQSCFFSQLFPYMSRRLRRLRKSRLQNFQLLRLYRRPWASAFGAPVTIVRRLVLGLGVPRLGVAVKGALGSEEVQLNATMWSGLGVNGAQL